MLRVGEPTQSPDVHTGLGRGFWEAKGNMILAMVVAGTCGVSAAVAISGALYLDRRWRLYLEWRETHRAEMWAERFNQAMVAVGAAMDESMLAFVASARTFVLSLQAPFEQMSYLVRRMLDAEREQGETELEWWHRHIAEVKNGGR